MKVVCNVYLNGFKKEINRKICVNDNITLKKFCELIIISMNGNLTHLYQLVRNEMYTYLGHGNKIIDSMYEEMMEDTTLNDIGIMSGDYFNLNYDYQIDWEFMIEVQSVDDDDYDNEFEIISGNGNGIIEDLIEKEDLKEFVNPNLPLAKKNYYLKIIKGYEDYVNKEFDIKKINQEIYEQYNFYLMTMTPKRYIMNISLKEYDKEIKRKISADSNTNLDRFCRLVIASMNGDLSHAYAIKLGKEYLDDDELENCDLNYLRLKEKQRLKVIYDFGDNWVFNVTVSKILDGYGPKKRFEVLSGKGYGIIDDCGGVFFLDEAFDDRNYNIEDFDIDKTNMIIDNTL